MEAVSQSKPEDQVPGEAHKGRKYHRIDQYQRLEAIRLAQSQAQGGRGAHRMADPDHLVQTLLVEKLFQIVCQNTPIGESMPGRRKARAVSCA